MNKKVILIVVAILILAMLFIIAFGVFSVSMLQNASNNNYPTATVKPSVLISRTPLAIERLVDYEVIYRLSDKRYDGGEDFYVLIDSVNLENDSFKDDIKKVIKDMVEDYGGKISIEIHDDRDSLDISYSQYGDYSLGRPRNDAENEILAIHFIAIYAGQLETGLYNNTLMFFPAAFSDHQTVGEYVKSEEYNP